MRHFIACRSALLALLLILVSTAVPAHDEKSPHAKPVRVLGTIDFPTSARSPDAQRAFIRGVLLLHLFEYPFAKDEFLDAQRIEPGFVLAYWGEALTYNHPIWDEQDLTRARAALAKLATTADRRIAMASTPREKGLLASLDILYGDGTKAERDRAYAQALQALAERFPADREVQLQYSLALMGAHAGVRDVPSYMRAAAIAQRVFCANPKHPGAAHYLIHAVDDPDHAVLGLDAARALEKMAPDASHSLHMASHIYVALGMWDDVVRANEAAGIVRNRMSAERGEKPTSWGHANFWLLYGYLQQGRYAQARQLLDKARQQLLATDKPPPDPLELDPDNSIQGSVAQMWARYLIETGEWDGEVAGWTLNARDAYDARLTLLHVAVLRAARTSRPDEAMSALERFRALRGELDAKLHAQAENKPTDRLYLKRLDVLDQEMQAQIERARGNLAVAVERARAASRLEGEIPAPFGPPYIDWPAAEMAGQLMLESGDYAGASAAFETQLKRTTSRPAALVGRARSEAALGHVAAAQAALAQVRSIWSAADPSVKSGIEAERIKQTE
ncbi:MAG TPA: hypothetical protein VLB69_00735 [Rudaea sp.]|nr:hypothetical protein [Rudaea sp.]